MKRIALLWLLSISSIYAEDKVYTESEYRTKLKQEIAKNSKN